MGSPKDDRARRVAPLSGPRRRAWHALLSALAGGGLTLSGLGLTASDALAAGEPSPTTSPQTSPPPAPASGSHETPSGTSGSPEGTTASPPPANTSSTPAPPTKTSAPPASAPAPAASSKPSAESKGSSPVTVEATAVVLPPARRHSS